MITLERLKELLTYTPETGAFVWKLKCGRRGPGGSAGYINTLGRRIIMIAGKSYIASRLAIFYMTGNWPIGDVDHIDRNRANDAIDNLRICTRSQNNTNSTFEHPRKKKTLPRGVYKRGRKFAAHVSVKNKSQYLGSYDTVEEAQQAYFQALIALDRYDYLPLPPNRFE